MDTICFVNHDLSVIGGAHTVVVNIANELCNNYNVVMVSVCNRRGTLAYKLDERITYINLEIDTNARLRQKMKNSFWTLLKIYKKYKVKVAFLEENRVGFFASVGQPFTKTKLIFCDHASFASEAHKKDVVFMRRIATLLCYRTVVLTKHSMNAYLNAFKMNPKKISYIYNWISDELLKPERHYDLNSKTIISVGRLDEEKGFDLMVQVAKNVLPKYPDWQWHIYGKGDLDNEVRMWVKELGIREQVVFKGLQPDLDEAYKQAALLVLPSYREGLPLVLLEAVAYELPAISFDIITGPREILRDGENTFLIKCYDTDAMADKICYLIEHPEVRQRFSENMKLNVDEFRVSTIRQKWIDIIEKC